MDHREWRSRVRRVRLRMITWSLDTTRVIQRVRNLGVSMKEKIPKES